MLKVNFEDGEDGDEWGTHVAAWYCLQRLSVLLKDDVIEKTVAFAAPNIQDMSVWQRRYVGLMALGSIAEGPDK